MKKNILLIILSVSFPFFFAKNVSAVDQCNFATSPSPAEIGKPATFTFSNLAANRMHRFLFESDPSGDHWDFNTNSGGQGSVSIPQVKKNDFTIFQDGVTRVCNGYISGAPGGSGYKPDYCLGSYGIQTAIGCIPTTPSGFAWFFLKYLLGIAGLIAFFLIILAAFQILTSGGNPEKLEGGKQLLTAALVGLFFIIFSVVILQLIGINILGGLPGFPSFQKGEGWYPGEP